MGNIGKELRKEKNIIKIHCIKFPKSKSKLFKGTKLFKEISFSYKWGLRAHSQVQQSELSSRGYILMSWGRRGVMGKSSERRFNEYFGSRSSIFRVSTEALGLTRGRIAMKSKKYA